MNAIRLSDNLHGTIGGSISTIAGAAVGLIGTETIIEAIIVALIGAVVGYLTNIVIKRVERWIKNRFNG